MQRQAGVVGVFQSVLKLHLHRQTPTRAANHIRLLSVEKTQCSFTSMRVDMSVSVVHKGVSYPYLVPDISI